MISRRDALTAIGSAVLDRTTNKQSWAGYRILGARQFSIPRPGKRLEPGQQPDPTTIAASRPMRAGPYETAQIGR
jgi:hypothetical protein